MSAYREYENGVADVLRYIMGDTATVALDVQLPGSRSGTLRQIDVLVTGEFRGFGEATLVVDCKQWNTRLDVTDVEAFLAFLDDVGADLGLLVATSGYSAAAKRRARDARGVRAEVLTHGELAQWSPRGTVHVTYRLRSDLAVEARAALTRVGLRVREASGWEHLPDESVLEAYQFASDGSEPAIGDVAEAALASAGIAATVVGSGTTIGGGTPAHRWLEVADREGQQLGLKILVCNETEITSQLRDIAHHIGIPLDQLDVVRPNDWPVVGLFGLPADRDDDRTD